MTVHREGSVADLQLSTLSLDFRLELPGLRQVVQAELALYLAAFQCL